MKDYILIRKKTFAGCFIIIVITMIAITIYMICQHFKPEPKPVLIETKAYNILKADGRNILFFRYLSKDSLLCGADLNPDKIGWAWNVSASSENLHRIIAKNKAFLTEQKREIADKTAETDYFIKRHNVQDEGFDMVVRHNEELSKKNESIDKLIAALGRINKDSKLEIVRKASYADARHIKPSGIFLETDGGLWQNGTWLRTKRKGKGISIDADKNFICGSWNADTILEGRKTNDKGCYIGHFNKNKEAEGHGIFVSDNGSYYEGRWVNGMRNGFGFELSRNQMKAGEWKNNTYKGERISYTSERIYGIDISKYQHGKGRKFYPIHWNRLRITDLGRLSKKNIDGAVNYPVSFVYIKSTEGTSIRNHYYASDYKQAKIHGFHCGAYHFFSTKTSAAAQAQYFIKHTFFKKGDLPPVLDVEPSNRQITNMGGEKALFNAIRTWMRIVRQHTKVKPILYVNQTFVNKYLNSEPDILKDYNVWIARYGEYKPGVKLVYWQLSPDGRVNGIHGDVDINVFNGYKDSFDLFLNTERIK